MLKKLTAFLTALVCSSAAWVRTIRQAAFQAPLEILLVLTGAEAPPRRQLAEETER
ncbi:MAG: hypothetical protein ACLR3U_05300 [Christensenellaceae bacterium]